VESGDELVRDSGSRVSLGDSVSAGAIAVGVSGNIGGDSVSSVEKSGVGVSTPLAETLGGPGNEAGGGTGMASDSGESSVSIGVGVSSIGVSSVVGAVKEGGVSLSISRSLAVQVQVSRSGGGSNLSSQTIGGGGQSIGVGVSSIGVGETGVSVSSVKESGISLGLGISGPLAIGISGSAAEAGGLAVGGGHSWPVRVGIEQSRGVTVDSSVGLGRDGDSGASNNLREREVSGGHFLVVLFKKLILATTVGAGLFFSYFSSLNTTTG